MKKIFTLSLILFLFSNVFTQTRTSVANGNWMMPTTWDCNCIPTPGNDVIINHTVTLTMDWGYSSGSITVNASGSLIQDSSPRSLAQNGGSFSNAGTVTLSKVAVFNGSFANTGTFHAIDSLYIAINMTNTGTVQSSNLYSSGILTNDNTITGTNFYNAGTFYNNGQAQFTYHYNNGSSNNNGTMSFTDYTNAGTFIINEQKELTIMNDCTNGDTLNHDAHWYNYGHTIIYHDFTNIDILDGTNPGTICVAVNSVNNGSVLGSFDYCTPVGGFDINNGSISNGITNCTTTVTCWENISNVSKDDFNIFPNPVMEILTIKQNNFNIEKIEIINATGKIVFSKVISDKNEIKINRSGLPSGLYFIKVFSKEKNHIEKVIFE